MARGHDLAIVRRRAGLMRPARQEAGDRLHSRHAKRALDRGRLRAYRSRHRAV